MYDYDRREDNQLGCASCGLAGMGLDIQEGFDTISNFDPTGTSQLASSVIHAFQTVEGWLNIGTGRNEADLIVPIQNAIGDRLVQMNNEIATSNIPKLQSFILELQQMGTYFRNFVGNKTKFPDGRASTQALNTIMPLIDGTNSTYNLVRADQGTTGSVTRRLQQIGGVLPPPTLTQGYGGEPSLQYQTQSYPWLPQAGSLPPLAPLSSLKSTPIEVVGAGFGGGTVPIIGAGLLLLLLSRRARL
jgi:hypothetical protein